MTDLDAKIFAALRKEVHKNTQEMIELKYPMTNDFSGYHFGNEKYWKKFNSHGELDVDLPIQFGGGAKDSVKLKAQLKRESGQIFVDAVLYGWDRKNAVEMGRWRLLLEGTTIKKPPSPLIKQREPTRHNPWLIPIGAKPGVQTFQAQYNPLQAAVRRLQEGTAATSYMSPGARYSDLYTRKTYEVDAFGRHTQTGWIQGSATQPGVQTFQAQHDPLQAAVRKLMG